MMFALKLNSLFQNIAKTEGLRLISVSAPRFRDVVDRKLMLKSLPAADEGTAGEKTVDIDSLIGKNDRVFPTLDTPNWLFDGVAFKDLPICNIKVTPNNTILNFTDAHTGYPKLLRSCGIEGFKNTRKGTNVAAQATAISMATKILEKGFKTVRVRIQGLGPGRLSAIKGLQMGGLNIISITDNTKVTWTPLRPRKAKRL